MMTQSNRPDDSGEDNSQVRNIIRQLNEDAPGKEKAREIVVRPDGSKVVRVTKKRKAMITKEEKSRHSRKTFMQGFFAILLLLAGVTAFFFYRVTTMSGERYLAGRSSELAEYWGATSVRCTGAVIDGINFHIGNIVAEFPESSMIARVELSGIESELDLGSFFTGVLTGESLNIARAHITLHSSARQLNMPRANGDELWNFLRVSCPDLSISFAGPDASPWSIRHTNAYMYRPSSGSSLTVVTFEGGTMQMKGWKAINIQSAKMHLSQLAIEDFTLDGTTDNSASTSESSKTSITFSGRVAGGGALAGPYYFISDNMNFSDFSEGRFNQFFAARTVRPQMARTGSPTTQMLLPLDRAFPQFMGTFNLKEVSISGFPAQQMIVEHIEPSKRKRYLPPSVLFASVRLEHDGAAMTLSFDESGMNERDVITLRGTLRVDEMSELSGTLDYGIPAVLTHAEYRDGKPDPLFREDGQLAWVSTTVSGPAAHPQDNSYQLDIAAAPARAGRERIPFEDIDLERVSEFYKSREQQAGSPQEGMETPVLPPAPEGGEGQKPANRGLDPLDPLAPGGSSLLPSF